MQAATECRRERAAARLTLTSTELTSTAGAPVPARPYKAPLATFLALAASGRATRARLAAGDLDRAVGGESLPDDVCA